MVVFDNYPEYPTIKDTTHIRRASSICPDIEVNSETIIDVTKSQFLSNKRNKQRFIIELGRYLEQVGFTIKNAEYDADHLIAITALELLEEDTCVQV